MAPFLPSNPHVNRTIVRCSILSHVFHSSPSISIANIRLYVCIRTHGWRWRRFIERYPRSFVIILRGFEKWNVEAPHGIQARAWHRWKEKARKKRREIELFYDVQSDFSTSSELLALLALCLVCLFRICFFDFVSLSVVKEVIRDYWLAVRNIFWEGDERFVVLRERDFCIKKIIKNN